jgi:hypothetical protein
MLDGGKSRADVLGRLRNMLSACFLLPDMKCLDPNSAIRVSGHKVSARMEMSVNECVSGKKTLGLLWRCKSLHLPFASSCRPM